MDLPVCRVCLACDVSHSVRDVQLRETYERLAGAKFYSVDKMPVPVTLCYYCYWQLRKFSNFAAQARSSHKILKEAIKCGAKVGLKYIQNQPKKCHLTMSTIKTLTLNGSLKRKSCTNPLKKMVKKVRGENINNSLKPLLFNTQNLKSILKNSSITTLELHLAGNPELIIKKQKKPEKFEGEIVQINTEIEMEHNENEKLSPNKIQSTKNNAQSDPQMIEEFLDFDYDRYDETLYPCHESKKIISTEKYLAEHYKKPNNKKCSNLKETKIETQTCGIIKIKNKNLDGINRSGGNVFRPVAYTSLDIPNLNMVAEFLEIENDSDLRTNSIVNNQDKQDTVYQVEENVDHQDTHNNNTQSETQSIENVSENRKIEIKNVSQSKEICGTINSASKHLSTTATENITSKLIYKCNFCKKVYTTKENLDEHIEQAHTMSSVNTKTYIYACKECGQKFSFHSHLVEHIRKHTNERPFMCEICGKSYMTRSNLDGHLFQVHSKSKHVCKLCNKSFKSKCYLYNYHLNVHFNVRPFVCHVCKTAFHQSGALWEHIRNVHQGRKRYACDICSLKWDSKSHLKRHMLTHSGIKAFSCDYCNMDFTTKGTMRRHVARYCKMK